MDSAVDVFSAQVSKLSMHPGDKAECVCVYDLALCASLLRCLQSFLLFSASSQSRFSSVLFVLYLAFWSFPFYIRV